MCWNITFISSVDQDISRVSKANYEWYILHVQHEKYISHFQAFMYCSVYYIYKKIALLSHKNKAVNSNAFHDNHTCDIIDFISGGNINKTLYFI